MSKRNADGGMVLVVYVLICVLIAIALFIGVIFHEEIGGLFRSDKATVEEYEGEFDNTIEDGASGDEVGDSVETDDDEENWTKNY